MILGKDFLNYAKAFLVPHEGCLVFLDESKMPSVPMTMKSKLGWKPISVAMRLIEGACGSVDRPCDMVQQQEVIPAIVSLSVMNQEE
jgi:hypothetical protein